MHIAERITKIRELMKANGIDIYVVPTADFHQSEYVGEHFKARSFMTGFTGSAGTAIITMEEACLWTDGRYFIQAGEQLKNSSIQLMKMGEPGVPTIEAFIAEKLPQGGVLGFDGRVVSMGDGQSYEAVTAEKGASIQYNCDLVDAIWTERPALSEEPTFILGVEYAGESVASKLARVRAAMREVGANVHVIASLDDVNWILNLRGNDIAFCPLVLSYAIITMDKMDLFMNKTKLADEVIADFAKDGIEIRPYNEVYEAIKAYGAGDTILVDPVRMNYALYNNISNAANKVEKQNPTVVFKAMKNPVEIENIKKAQIKDGVAHVKFMYWLKKNVGNIPITELSASSKLEEFRAQQGRFIRPSFAPISAYGAHGAMCHYESTPETNVELKEGSLFLTDTGGGYMEGSTDITRTFALGEIPEIMKEHFTVTLQSNLHLAHASFLHGANGVNLDILARLPFWKRNLNYNHGTGHGVGYLMNIHEAPSGFRWQYRPGDSYPFQEGMILTNEPGIYIAGSHGVRLENELLVCKGEANEYGQFMHFEVITFVPFDLDAVNPEILTAEEKVWLNEYHAQVFEKISPYLEAEEVAFLKEYTKAV